MFVYTVDKRKVHLDPIEYEIAEVERAQGGERCQIVPARERRVRRRVAAPILRLYRERESKLRVAPTGEVVVRLTGTGESCRERLFREFHPVRVARNPYHERQYLLALERGEPGREDAPAVQAANALAERDDLVAFAVPNFLSEFCRGRLPNDPLLRQQWHLGDERGLSAFSAWGVTAGGDRRVVVAVLDDGVEIGHRDLRDNIVGRLERTNFFDLNRSGDPRPRYFRSPFDDTAGNDIHGTPCAGLVAAVGDNRRGGAGAAFRAQILPVKIFGGDSLAATNRVADAIRRAGRNADVISLSWACPWSADIEAATRDVTESGRAGKGCAVFAATGNEGAKRVAFPASLPNVMGVGACNDQGRRSTYSNFGAGLDFVAPSSDPERGCPSITTTDVSRPNRGYNLHGAYTDKFGGTSAATPLAAGVAALVLSVASSLSWKDLRSLLRITCDRMVSGRRLPKLEYGYGRLNAAKAVAQARLMTRGGRSRLSRGGGPAGGGRGRAPAAGDPRGRGV